MDNARTDRQLALIAEISDLAARLGVEVWLRGGWAMDFFLGEPTRDHRDIDWFIWADRADRLHAELLALGYVDDPEADRSVQLDLAKNGEDLQFALLARDAEGRVVIAGGPWSGTPWPDGMLDAHPGRIGTLTCPIIAPAVQIEIKRMMPVWVPGRPRRPKDAEDIARLEQALGDPAPHRDLGR